MAGGDAMNYDAFTIKSKFECNSTSYISEQSNETSAYVGLLDNDTIKCQDDLIDEYHLNLASLDTNRSQSSSSLSTSSKESRKIHYINSAIFIERDDSTSNLCYDSEFDDNNHVQNNTYRTNNRQQCMKNRCLKLELQNDDSKVTIKSLSPSDVSTNENTKRSRCMTFKEWLAHKQQIKQKQRKMVVDSKEKQREQGKEQQRRVNEQREDFQRWLAIKKEQEIQKKKEAELRALKIRQENEMRAQKMAEKEQMFKVWTRRKAEEAKEKKRQEEERLRQIEEMEKERKEKSAKAFEEWAKKSKYNPRPVPLNMGVESLKGSVSAMFVNPTPWKENTDIRQTSSA